MPTIQTAYFGELEYLDSAVFQFPYGLPGFESEKRFLFLNQPQTDPLMFMQSLDDSQLCFVLLPILVADPRYRMNLDGEELAALQLPVNRQPRIGEEILCAAILRADDETGATANLLAPIVVNLKKQVGVQVIQTETTYSHRHPIAADKELVTCS